MLTKGLSTTTILQGAKLPLNLHKQHVKSFAPASRQSAMGAFFGVSASLGSPPPPARIRLYRANLDRHTTVLTSPGSITDVVRATERPSLHLEGERSSRDHCNVNSTQTAVFTMGVPHYACHVVSTQTDTVTCPQQRTTRECCYCCVTRSRARCNCRCLSQQ